MDIAIHGDLGVLVPIEHAMLAHGVADQERTRTFARYSLIGALSMAAGALAAAAPDFLVLAGLGPVSAFKLMFYAYAALGVAYSNLGERSLASENLRQAFELREHDHALIPIDLLPPELPDLPRPGERVERRRAIGRSPGR